MNNEKYHFLTGGHGNSLEIRERSFYKTVKDILLKNCRKILYVDITCDCYEVIAADTQDLEYRDDFNPSDKMSEWFSRFADSPFCYDDDRQRFREFTDLRRLEEQFKQNGYKPVTIAYRRKYNLSDYLYSTVSMELFPEINEDGHLVAFLFVRNITSEFQKFEAEILDFGPGALKKTILIVEDNELNREILSEILSDTYTVLQAENGAEGLEILQKRLADISLVILDVQMPVMDGYKFLELAQNDPFLSEIPVLVATSNDSIEEENRCLKLGASDFVTKPYNPDIIKSRISSIIRLKESTTTMAMLQTDERTGLYTLQAFYYYAKQKIEQADDKYYTVTILDIDHFRSVNETYGEPTGDRVLHEIAVALKGYTAASEINARFGAARFLLLTKTMPLEQLDSWIRGLFGVLENSCCIKGIRFKAGIYSNVDKSLKISDICNKAISALNCNQQSVDSRYALYDAAQEELERRRAIMEMSMHEAYEKGQFDVYYQPKHDAKTGSLIGAEALIRWNHPELGFLSPGEFIPLFERNGFVLYADYYVLKKTCENLRRWIEEGLSPVPVSVNASRRNFEREDGMITLNSTVDEYSIDPSLIHIEVTESFFSERLEEMAMKLKDAKDKGFCIELDDFGTGYSSITNLASLPIDVMKLDMSFMRNYKDEKKRKVLSTCINLAHSLGIRTISEGVETEDQLNLLKQYGCDGIQGYYFSKPLPEKEFREYLSHYSNKRSIIQEDLQ